MRLGVLKRFSFFFIPSVFQGVVSIAVLPVATIILGPTDYGLFALVSAYTALGSALAGIGGGYVIANRFPTATAEEKQAIVSTICLLGVIVVSLLGCLLGGVLFHAPFGSHLPFAGLMLSIATMVLAHPWSVAVDIITIEGNAKRFAIVTILQAIVSALSLLAALFVLKLEMISLFVAHFAGGIVSLAGAFVVLRRYLTFAVSPNLVREIFTLGRLNAVGSLLEGGQAILERTLLLSHVGAYGLGLYAHSQQYRATVGVPVKAIARTIWPITLEDARRHRSDFDRPKLAWDVAYVGIALAGVVFATFGDRLIGVLTNGKFNEAYLLATAWMAFLLVQNMGKPQTGVLYALEGGRVYAKLLAFSGVLAILALVVLVPPFGIWGAMGAAFLQQVTLRYGIQRYAQRLRKTPTQDAWAFGGIIIIGATVLARNGLGDAVLVNGSLLLFASVLIVVLARAPLANALARILRKPTVP